MKQIYKMANGSKGPARSQATHLLLISSLLLTGLVLVLFAYSPSPVRCSSPSVQDSSPAETSKSVQNIENSHQDSSSSCRLDEDSKDSSSSSSSSSSCELSRKQNDTTTSAVYGRAPGEGEIHLVAGKSDHDEAQSWRYKYFEEQARGYEVKVIDESLDERLANIIYTLVSVRPVNVDFFTYNSGDPGEDAANMEAAAGPLVDTTQCGRHLDEMLGLLDEMNNQLALRRENSSARLHFNEQHLRLARVLDTYGRYESGHLTAGRQHAPGEPDQCTRSNLLLSSARVPANFCWARMDLNKHLHGGLAQRTKSDFEAVEHPFMVGICLPRTCHSKTFAANRERIQRLVDSQFQMPRSLFIEQTLRVNSVYCTVDSESAYARLPLAGRLALAFLVGWLALTLYATFRDSRQASDFWDCLDLRKSWREFAGDRDEDLAARARHESQVRQRKVELDALNPIKVAGCAFVVLGHALVLQSAVAGDGLTAVHMAETDPVVLGMIAGTVVVDTFFVITGILLGYMVMRKANPRRKVDAAETFGRVPEQTNGDKVANGQDASDTLAQPPVERDRRQKSTGGGGVAAEFLTQWLKFAVTRHLRLVPLFFLVFWFKKSVLINYFSSWPLWDAGFNKDTNFGSCLRESWSTPFSIMASFLPLSKQCIPQGWSVATDLFFSMTIPPVMLIMPRHPRLALAIGACLTLMSNVWALSAYHSVDPHMAHEMNDLRAHGFSYMFGSIHYLYTYPHFRFGTILIGMMAGYFLYQFGEQPDERKQWPGWFRGPATKGAFGAILGIIFGFAGTHNVKYYMAPYHQGIFTQLFTTGRIVWALCNAVLFMRMVSDWRRNFLMRAYSSRLWQALVKLNLAILLIHLDVLLFFLESNTQLGHFSKRDILANFGTAYFYCIPLAMLLHLVYENPIDKLIKRFVVPKLFAS